MKWRRLDTGPRSAAENMALDRALLDARIAQRVPNTLRFLQFSPSAVLVGHHQAIEQEARHDYCRSHGIGLNRRLTGGGAIYFDPSQIGWELVARVADFGRPRMDELTARICEAAAAGLRRLGPQVNAEFRPRNDIEVDGKKISGTGGTVEDGVFLFQGTVLTDFDIEAMLLALRIPTEKLTEKGLETARERVTCLRELFDPQPMPGRAQIEAALEQAFAEAFGVEFERGELSEWEQQRFAEVLPEYEDPEWIHAVEAPAEGKALFRSIHKRPGGLLRIHALVDVERSWLRQVLISGDFFISPRRAVFDLEAALKDTPFAELGDRVRRFFAEREHEIDLLGLGAEDFVQAIRLALDKVAYIELGITASEASAIYPVNIPAGVSVQEVAAKATVMLLPYCAKLPECEFRFTQGCSECGKCTVGDAYRVARDKGITAVSIIKFEHLKGTLARMREQGVESYVGMCCEPFFVKRNEAFRDAGIPGVLMDISGKTCYELGEEGKAYAGTFVAQADLKLSLMRKVSARIENANGKRFRPGSTPARDHEESEHQESEHEE